MAATPENIHLVFSIIIIGVIVLAKGVNIK